MLIFGFIKLLKKQFSHKFVGGHKSIDEILKCIENMDDTLTSWYDWIDVGRFDFERGGTLKQDISYFVHSKFHIHHTVIGMWMARWLLIKQKQRLLGLFLQSAFPEKAALR